MSEYLKTNTMKKLLLFLLLVSLTVSCSKDEDEKVDTSTFTGLYNDTIWVVDYSVPIFGEWKEYLYFKNNKVYFGGLDYLDTAPDCRKDTREYSEDKIYQSGTEDENEIIYQINTPNRLVIAFEGFRSETSYIGYSVSSFSVENGNLLMDYGAIDEDGDFDINNVVWEGYIETYEPSNDFTWIDYLAFECDNTTYKD